MDLMLSALMATYNNQAIDTFMHLMQLVSITAGLISNVAAQASRIYSTVS